MYEWNNESCAQKNSGSIQAAWKSAKAGRAKAAAKLTPGEWCVVLAPDDEEEEFWLARTVAVDSWDGGCTRKHNNATTINRTRYDKGDVEIAVQWYGQSLLWQGG